MDLHLLRLALSHHMGSQLTPELAQQILFIAAGEADFAPDPAAFELEEHGGCRIGVERLRDLVPEIHPLHELHWQETEKYRHGLLLSLDYQQMCAWERTGRLIQFVVRAPGGQLVGQCRMYLAKSMHAAALVAEEDTLFIHPDYRGQLLGVRLLRYVERVLVKQFGVHEIRANSKLANNADVLMRRLKYEAVATQFAKVFPPKGAEDVQ